MKPQSSMIARFVAPIALAVVAIAVVVVIGLSLGGRDSDDGNRRGGGGGARTAQEKQRKPKEDTYVVEPGDSLSSIAENTGVPVERLIRLNPDLDPQALISGEKVKLR